MDGGIYLQNNPYVGAIFADVHTGAFKPVILYNEFKEEALEYLEGLAILDFIVICGDFFHTKLSMNSDHAKYAFQILMRLLDICEKKNAKLRIVKGTESHDNKQLEIFESIIKMSKYDFKIIDTVGTEMLFDDMKVLYIPEEYVEDKDEYYKDYFDQEYDMIFGHGLVSEVVFVASRQESEETMAKAPVFKSEELLRICKGPVFFGHIHTPQVINDRFIYVGSFSRWSFGEEEDKGFYTVSYETDSSNFMTEFIVNKKARKYDTITIDYTSPIFDKSETEQVDYLIKLANSLVIDYLRLEINIPEEYDKSPLLVNMINDVFNKYPNIKTKINNNKKLRQKKETEEKINLLLTRYGFIFDKTLSHEEKLSLFIKEKYNRNIPVNKMRQYLYEQLRVRGSQHGV